MDNVVGLIAGSSGDSLTHKLQCKGYKVALVCGSKDEPGCADADYTFVCNLASVDSVVTFLKNKSVGFVVFGTGHYLIYPIVKKLTEVGIESNIDIDGFALVKDKIKLKEKVEKVGYLTPKYFPIKSKSEYFLIREKIKFPCVVKSAIDCCQPAKVYGLDRLNFLVLDILRNDSNVLIEDFISGEDCTVAVSNNSFSVKDYGVLYYSKAKEYKLEGFYDASSEPLSQSIEENVRKTAIEVVKAVGITGLVRVDFIVKGVEVYILEVNAVIVTGYNGSAYPFFKNIGVDIAEVMIDTSLDILNK